MEATGEFYLSVPYTETRSEAVLQQQVSKPFTVFVIKMGRVGDKEWQVDRRFNDFLTLHKTLKEKFPMVVQVFAATFPKKKMLLKTLDPRTIEERRAFFETYLRALLELSPRPGDVNAFLKIDVNPPTESRKKKSAESAGLELDDFEVLETLGSGAFGKVLLVRLLGTDELFAMKVLKKNDVIRRNQVEHTLTERAVMETISHPFIVPLRFSFQSKTRLFMVSEFCPGGELFYHLKDAKSFDEEAVKFFASEILMAMEHLHSCNIVYRDLKPENVLLDAQGHVRITDFGLSKQNVTYDGGAKTYCGTPEYLAPEMILVKRQDLLSYGFAIDWWSLGTFCYELYVGHPPFQDRNVKIMTERILTERVRFPHTSKLPTLPFRDFVFALLNRDPAKRLGTTTPVRDHMFFEHVKWEEEVFTKKQIPPVVPKFDPLEATVNFDPQSEDEDTEAASKSSRVLPPNSTTNTTNNTTTTNSTSGVKKFLRFVPLSQQQQQTNSSSNNNNNSSRYAPTSSTAAAEEEEDELTAMFKSFAFERESSSLAPSAVTLAAAASDTVLAENQSKEEENDNGDLRSRNKQVGSITEFEALWGEAEAEAIL